MPAQAIVPANYSATYLVVGSFRRLDNAKRRAARLSDATLRMTDAVVDGEVFHRVVAGPFGGEDIAAARLRAVAAGVVYAGLVDPLDPHRVDRQAVGGEGQLGQGPGLADQGRETRFDIHVHVFQGYRPLEVALFDALFDLVQTAEDGVALLGGNDFDPGQHASVGS